MAPHNPGKQPASPVKTPAARDKVAGVAVSANRKRVDWEAVERDFRTGKFTQRELADKYGVTHGAVGKRARDHGWQKDLTAEIRQATNAKLVQELVSKEVAKGSQEVSNTVLAAAEINKNVILAHRDGLNRITSVKQALLGQIEQAAANMVELSEVIEMVRNPDENGIDRANDMMRKAMGRSALVDDLKKLTEVDERVRKGEREAFGLDVEAAPQEKGLADLATDELKRMRERLRNES